VIKPVIDRTFTLEQILDAHEYVEAGGKIWGVVVTMTYSKKPLNL
jgi:hypothetical protein